jgi:hypothetical protein
MGLAVVLPAYSGSRNGTLVDVNGFRVLGVLALPALAALIVWFMIGRRGNAIVVGPLLALMWLFTLLGAASVGLFYLPATVALTVAAASAPQMTAT